MLIKCPECGKEISDKSKVCLNCGYKIKSKRKIILFVTLGIISLFLVFLLLKILLPCNYKLNDLVFSDNTEKIIKKFGKPNFNSDVEILFENNKNTFYGCKYNVMQYYPDYEYYEIYFDKSEIDNIYNLQSELSEYEEYYDIDYIEADFTYGDYEITISEIEPEKLRNQ